MRYYQHRKAKGLIAPLPAGTPPPDDQVWEPIKANKIAFLFGKPAYKELQTLPIGGYFWTGTQWVSYRQGKKG